MDLQNSDRQARVLHLVPRYVVKPVELLCEPLVIVLHGIVLLQCAGQRYVHSYERR